jgi:hypothetical protein
MLAAARLEPRTTAFVLPLLLVKGGAFLPAKFFSDAVFFFAAIAVTSLL